MKVIAAVAMLGAYLLVQVIMTEAAGGNPVQGVVKMLQELQARVEKEGEAEESLYDKYKCWATKSNDEKTKAVEAAEAEIQMQTTKKLELQTTLTSQKLAKKAFEDKIGEVNASIKSASAAREAEKLANKAKLNETLNSIEGLETAEDVLDGNATTPSTMLLSLRGGKRSLLRKKNSAAALDVTQKYLSAGDAVFMRSLIESRVVPTQVQTALSKAAHSSDPAARTNKVVKTLNKMEDQLGKNANTTAQDEIKDASSFLEMMKEKHTQISLLKKQLSTIAKEQAQRAVDIGEAEDRISELNVQIGEDKGFIKNTTAALDSKTAEWEDRSKIRQDELTALSGAVALLNDPEQTSVISSAYSTMDSFFQEYSVIQSEQRLAVSQALHQAGLAAHDSRLLALAASAASEANFSVVLSKIDSMIQMLDAENSSDTVKKEACLANLSANLEDSKKTSSDISDFDTSIDGIDSDLKNIGMDIAEKKDEITATQEELSKATENRGAENAEYVSNKKDDQTAMSLLDKAVEVLKGFYKGAGTKSQSLLQRRSSATTQAPETWGDGSAYSGSSAAGIKIIALMGSAKADLKADMDTADTCEKNSVKLYKDAKTSLEQQIVTLQTEIEGGAGVQGLKEQKATKKGDKAEKATARNTKNDQLEAIEKRMKDAKPACDFIVDNFGKRLISRVKEKEGLVKAKGLLSSKPAGTSKVQS